MHISTQKIPISAILAIAFLAGQMAFSQDDSEDFYTLDPFTVSSDSDRGYFGTRTVGGLRTNTPLLELPLNVQVFNSDFLEDIGALKINDVLGYVSNTTGGDQRSDGGINIRGFGPTIYQDGLDFAFPTTFRSLDGIERVEIVKGASAALYNTTALGGIINYVKKRPLPQKQTHVRVIAGENSFYKGMLDHNEPLLDTEDLDINSRFVLSYEDSESWRPFAFTERLYFAPSIEMLFGNHTTVTTWFEYQEDDLLQNFAQPYIYRGTPTDEIPSSTTQTPDGLLLNLPIGFFRGEPTDGKQTESYTLSVSATHWFNSNWSAKLGLVGHEHDQERVETFISSPGSTIQTWPRAQQSIPQDNDSFSGDLGMVGLFNTGDVSHKVLFGLTYNASNTGNANIRRWLTPDFNVFNPVYGIGPGLNQFRDPTDDVGARRRNTVNASNRSFYLQDQVGFFNDRLILVLGGRWQDVRALNNVMNRDATVPTPNRSEDNRFFPRVSGVYKFTENVSGYFGFSDTTSPSSGQTDVDGVPLPDPSTEITEVGLKFDILDEKIFGTLSLFENIRTGIIVPDPINVGSFESTGEITAEGVDLDLGIQVTENLQLIAGLSSMSNEITADTRPARVGLGFRSIPNFTASFYASYDVTEGSLEGLKVGLGMIHEGDRWGDANNNFINPAYTIFNLNARYPLNERDTLSLQVNNVTDEEYFGFMTAERFAQAGDVRWIKLTYDARF